MIADVQSDPTIGREEFSEALCSDGESESDSDSEPDWKVIPEYSGYEICSSYPHQVRKISNKRIVKEFQQDGYIKMCLAQKIVRKHVIIAKVFIPNSDPDVLTVVDHINCIRSDNRIENLRWCTQKQNTNNRSDQTAVESIPEDAVVVRSYNNHIFEDVYLHNNTFYIYNGMRYVIRPQFEVKSGYYAVKLTDVDGVRVTVATCKLKKQLGLT